MEILVVDYNPVAARLISSVLTAECHRCTVAADGLAALETLDATPEVEIIITGIVMPKLDGLGFLEALRAKPEWTDTPVIVVSSTGDAGTVRRAAAFGVRHFIVSPFRTPHLLECVREAASQAVPVLRPRAQVLSTLGIVGSTYTTLGEALVEQAGVAIETLEDILDRGDHQAEAEGGDLGTSLTCLAESAAFLGAERAARALRTVVNEHISSPDADHRRDGQKIALRELRVLAGVFLQRPKTPPMPGESEDEPRADAATHRRLRYISR